MSNIVVLEKEERVDMYEWAKKYPNCHALYIKEKNDDNKTMLIKAYALNEKGNAELNTLPFAYNNDIGYFGGISKTTLGGLV